MLVIRSLTKRGPFLIHRSSENFYQRILGKYCLLTQEFFPELLIFLAAVPFENFELPCIRQNGPVDRFQWDGGDKILNQFLNRVLLYQTGRLTWQNRVYLSVMLYKLGIHNTQEFFTALKQAAGRETGKRESTEPKPARERYFLEHSVYRRLWTDEIYRDVLRSRTIGHETSADPVSDKLMGLAYRNQESVRLNWRPGGALLEGGKEILKVNARICNRHPKSDHIFTGSRYLRAKDKTVATEYLQVIQKAFDRAYRKSVNDSAGESYPGMDGYGYSKMPQPADLVCFQEGRQLTIIGNGFGGRMWVKIPEASYGFKSGDLPSDSAVSALEKFIRDRLAAQGSIGNGKEILRDLYDEIQRPANQKEIRTCLSVWPEKSTELQSVLNKYYQPVWKRTTAQRNGRHYRKLPGKRSALTVRVMQAERKKWFSGFREICLRGLAQDIPYKRDAFAERLKLSSSFLLQNEKRTIQSTVLLYLEKQGALRGKAVRIRFPVQTWFYPASILPCVSIHGNVRQESHDKGYFQGTGRFFHSINRWVSDHVIKVAALKLIHWRADISHTNLFQGFVTGEKGEGKEKNHFKRNPPDNLRNSMTELLAVRKTEMFRNYQAENVLQDDRRENAEGYTWQMHPVEHTWKPDLFQDLTGRFPAENTMPDRNSKTGQIKNTIIHRTFINEIAGIETYQIRRRASDHVVKMAGSKPVHWRRDISHTNLFYYIGNSVPYVIKTLQGLHTMCRGKLLRSRTLTRKVYKSLMSEGFRELKWTGPLCSDIGNSVLYVIKTLRGMHTMCRGKLLRSRTLARKVYKSLMSEGFRELKWTGPLCSDFVTGEKGGGKEENHFKWNTPDSLHKTTLFFRGADRRLQKDSPGMGVSLHRMCNSLTERIAVRKTEMFRNHQAETVLQDDRRENTEGFTWQMHPVEHTWKPDLFQDLPGRFPAKYTIPDRNSKTGQIKNRIIHRTFINKIPGIETRQIDRTRLQNAYPPAASAEVQKYKSSGNTLLSAQLSANAPEPNMSEAVILRCSRQLRLKKQWIKEQQWKEEQLKESWTKELRLKEWRTRELQPEELYLKVRQPRELQEKELRLKEWHTKELQLKERLLKELQAQELCVKEIQTKEPQLKKPQLKETQLKEIREKDLQMRDQEVRRMVQENVQEQVELLTDQVYRRLERRLVSEKKRRGL